MRMLCHNGQSHVESNEKWIEDATDLIDSEHLKRQE